MARKDIVLVKYGSFSHVNARIAALLEKEFPEHRLVVLDVARDLLATFPLASGFLRLFASARHPVTFVRGRHSPWDFVFRHAAAWRLISRWMAANISAEKTAFVFQTQSMFNAAHPKLPFFIYTDHTREAHRRQPEGGAPAPVGRGWVGLEKALYRRAETVFTLSRFCARSVVEDYGVPAERVVVASTGINIDLPADLPRAGAAEPVILFVGGEWRIKGGPELLRAFEKVRARMPAARLLVVGAAPPGRLDGVECLGRVAPGELSGLFRRASLLCVPSLVERASMVALDAAAHGLPVITTPHGAGSERVRDGVTGLLVDPRETGAFSDAILRLLDNPGLARDMGLAGRRMVEEEFTWDVVGARVAAGIRAAAGLPKP
jgi:glycosyltransferase involved in cell wall biosynthesis